MTDLHQTTPYNFGDAITRAFKLPGGISFLLRVSISAGLLLLIVYAVFGRGLFTGFFDLMTTTVELERSGADESEAVAAMISAMFSMMGTMFIIWLFSWVVMVSAETALHKNVFYGTDKGIFPLRFGVPELRVWLANFVVGLITYGIYFVGYIVFILFFALAAIGGQSHAALGVIFGILAFLAMFAWMGAIVFAWVRLSPAAALSVRDDEVRTLEGWHVSKTRFWHMLGSYIVVAFVGSFAMYVPMMMGFAVLSGPIMKLAGNPALESEDPSVVMQQMEAVFSEPLVIVGLLVVGLVFAILSIVYYMAIWGVANYVTDIDSPQTPEDVFS